MDLKMIQGNLGLCMKKATLYLKVPWIDNCSKSEAGEEERGRRIEPMLSLSLTDLWLKFCRSGIFNYKILVDATEVITEHNITPDSL